jgi:GTP 3',8-cyclase
LNVFYKGSKQQDNNIKSEAKKYPKIDHYKYGIGRHKLLYHPSRVNDWLKGKNIYPIYVEAAPAGGCNQRCIFCGLDYTGHKANFIGIEAWKRFAEVAGKKGVKSVLLSGEGEPLLHKDICRIAGISKENGMDIALASNAVLLTKDVCAGLIKYLTWMRVSLDAASANIYSLVHKTEKQAFDIVIKNVSDAVYLKNKHRYKTTIGIQFLLLKENCRELEKGACLARHIGVDYFSVKPYSKHPLSVNCAGEKIDYSAMLHMENRLRKYNTDKFKVIFRKNGMAYKNIEKPYNRCLGIPFWAYINSSGDVYPCSTFLGLKKYRMGNINQELFSDIWESARRRRILKLFEKMDTKKCRQLCRLDQINEYLWNLKHPPAHVNFI